MTVWNADDALTFYALRDANKDRLHRWHGPGTVPWTGADWSNALNGEAGEAANIVKKLRRKETKTESAPGPSILELRAKLADEIADVIIYADLLAYFYKINTAEAVVRKFNAVSEREGFPERL